MLKLTNVVKNYQTKNNTVEALKGISIEFRANEFVSVLGPSGCGKSTLLNIIGGLDRYSDGDLSLDNQSTKGFKDAQWDTYRNNTMGFVFQSYNLISHLTVLQNVEIALTLSGVSKVERKKRATEVLNAVGIGDQLLKRPNELSGGQMQRVAIARALVNNPKVILADEPTGAIDSQTSTQIMEILKKISHERLVIMVTHDEELAKKYSTRIVRLLDGVIIDDTKPFDSSMNEKEKAVTADAPATGQKRTKKTSMSLWTALKLSFNSLRMKKKRSILTTIACSIGILGLALVLALTNGVTGYTNDLERNTLASYPIVINQTGFIEGLTPDNSIDEETFTDKKEIYLFDDEIDGFKHLNNITEGYINYLKAGISTSLGNISYARSLEMNLVHYSEAAQRYTQYDLEGITWDWFELPASKNFTLSQYNLIGGTYPQNSDELALIVDESNKLDIRFLRELGYDTTQSIFSFDDFLGYEFKLIFNNVYYQPHATLGGRFVENGDYQAMWSHASSKSLKITGILRIQENSPAEMLGEGLAYHPSLAEEFLDDSMLSDVVVAQRNNLNIDVTSGKALSAVTHAKLLKELGGDRIPDEIYIYPVSYSAKQQIREYLDAYNVGKDDADKIFYVDMARAMANLVRDSVKIIEIILLCFAIIALVISAILIGFITYTSVIDRTKEIGILRAVGARKRDISMIFIAEALMIGLMAGVLGVILALIISIPFNIITENALEIINAASLAALPAFSLIFGSIMLTFIAGLVPSRIAAKKDPAVALRTE